MSQQPISTHLQAASQLLVRDTRSQLFDRHYRLFARFVAFLALMLLTSQVPVYAATLPNGFAQSEVGSGLDNPTAMAFAPDGRLFVLQQVGLVRVIKNDVLLATPFLTLPVNSEGVRGLLGIAFDPDFPTNNHIYLYYMATSPSIHYRVSRFTAIDDVVQPNS